MKTLVKLKGLSAVKKQLKELNLHIHQKGHYDFEVINTNALSKREELILFFKVTDSYFSIKTSNIAQISNENLVAAIRLVENFQRENIHYNPFDF